MSLRSSFQALRRLVHADGDAAAEEIPEAYPGQREQRLSLRLLSYWQHVRGGSEFPSRTQIDPAVIPDMWPYCFLLEIPEGADAAQARFSYIGAEIAGISQVSTELRALADLGGSTLLAKASGFLAQVLDRRVPITMGGEFRDQSGKEILYRSILLPLSENQDRIAAVLGAANCKEKGS